jgi:signal transduction histidine kinase
MEGMQPLNVLLALGNGALRTAAAGALASPDYALVQATQASEALARPAGTTFDLILVDDELPGADLGTLLAELRRTQGGYIALASTREHAAPVRSLVSDYLLRPFEADEFAGMVERGARAARLRHTLDAAQEELHAAHHLASIGKVAVGVGHEMRNILASIKNIAYFLKKKIATEDPQITYFINMLSQEADATTGIVSDLIDFSADARLSKSEVPVDELLDSAIATISPVAGVRIVRDIRPEGCLVLADPEKMRMVFNNLLLNALQSMPEGGTLNFQSRREGERSVIIFADTGHGIPAAIIGQVFDPLFSTRVKGVGLGLTVTRNIVERHGGTIGMQSEEGRGTTVTLTLPVR